MSLAHYTLSVHTLDSCISVASHYCDDGEIGRRSAIKRAREIAAEKGVTLGTVRATFSRQSGWSVEETERAPLCDAPDCTRHATTERVVSEVVHRLCGPCAAELPPARSGKVAKRAEETGVGYFYTRAPANRDFQQIHVWRSDDGVWMQFHPTDDQRGPIRAPSDVEIHAYTATEEQDRARRDALNEVIAAG